MYSERAGRSCAPARATTCRTGGTRTARSPARWDPAARVRQPRSRSRAVARSLPAVCAYLQCEVPDLALSRARRAALGGPALRSTPAHVNGAPDIQSPFRARRRRVRRPCKAPSGTRQSLRPEGVASGLHRTRQCLVRRAGRRKLCSRHGWHRWHVGRLGLTCGRGPQPRVGGGRRRTARWSASPAATARVCMSASYAAGSRGRRAVLQLLLDKLELRAQLRAPMDELVEARARGARRSRTRCKAANRRERNGRRGARPLRLRHFLLANS